MERNEYIDSLKGLLILLVVFGHMLLLSVDRGNSVNLSVLNVIYSFHMPCFVLISGYFTHFSSAEKFRKGITKFVEILIFFSIYSYLLDWELPKSLYVLLIPKFALWYLLCLIVWRIVLYVVNQSAFLSMKVLFVLSVIAALVCGCFIQIGPFMSLSRIIVFFPFFVLGYLMREKSLSRKESPLLLALSAAIMVTAIIVSFIFPRPEAWRFFTSNEPYQSFGLGSMQGVALRAAFLIVAAVLSFCVIELTPKCKILSQWGKASLDIYVWHIFFNKLFSCLLPQYDFLNNILVLLLVSVLVVVICYGFSQLKIASVVMRPMTFYKTLLRKKEK